MVSAGIAGCNNIVGLDKISVTDDPSLPANNSQGSDDGSGGTWLSESAGRTRARVGERARRAALAGRADSHGGAGGSASGGNDTVSPSAEWGSVEPAPDGRLHDESKSVRTALRWTPWGWLVGGRRSRSQAVGMA